MISSGWDLVLGWQSMGVSALGALHILSCPGSARKTAANSAPLWLPSSCLSPPPIRIGVLGYKKGTP